jgi:hypothetical protein
MEKNPVPGSEIDIPDQISESLVTILWVKNTALLCQFSVAALGSKIR